MKKIIISLIVICAMVMQLPTVSFATDMAVSSESDINVQRTANMSKKASSADEKQDAQSLQTITVDLRARTVNSPEINMYTGDKVQIQIAGSSNDTKISYASNKKTVADVDKDGWVSGIAAGAATVSVTVEDAEPVKVAVRVVNDKLSKPSVDLSQNGSGLNISWNKVSSAENYKVYRKVGNGNWNLVATEDSNTRKFTDQNIDVNKTYAYKVKATDVSYGLYRESSFSSSVSKKVTSISAPINVKAERAGYKTIKISWSKVYPATGYEIYRSKSGKSGTYSKIKTITKADTLSFSNTGLTAGKTYYYKVRAVSDAKKGSLSSYKSASPGLTKPVMDTSVSVTGSSIKLSWDKVSYAQGYYIYRKSNGSWKKIDTIKGNSTFSYKDTPGKGEQQYSIKAYRKEDGNSLVSSRSKTVSARTLKKPTITVDNPNNELKNKVTWTSVQGATEYQVWRKDEGKSWKLVSTKSSSRSYTASVNEGETVKWRVRAVCESDGYASVGAYSDTESYVVSFDPNYITELPLENQDNIRTLSLTIENVGNEPMTIYGDGYIMDYYNADYDRELLLYDVNTNKSMDCLVIEPGETKTVNFKVIGNATRYKKDSLVTFLFDYNGTVYAGVASVLSDNYFHELVLE